MRALELLLRHHALGEFDGDSKALHHVVVRAFGRLGVDRDFGQPRQLDQQIGGVGEELRVARRLRADEEPEALLRREAALRARVAHGGDHRLHRLDQPFRLGVLEQVLGDRIRRHHDGRLDAAELLPDLLGDERHERMQQAQRTVERFQQHAPRARRVVR